MRWIVRIAPQAPQAPQAPLAPLAPLAALAAVALLGACAAQLFCETNEQCREGELCDPTTLQCAPSPCHGAVVGAYVSCGEGDTLVTCGDAGEGLNLRECSYGCNPGTRSCNDCRPYTQTCQGGDFVRCGADGRVVTRELCDHGCSDGRGACNDCTPGVDSCEGDTLMLCDSAGLSIATVPCAHGCSAEQGACNECEPDQVTCDGAYRVTCGPQGIPAQGELCVHSCNEQRAQCNDCTPDTTYCDGPRLVTCDPDGRLGTTTECIMGCNHGATPARCYTFTPTALAETDLHAGQVDLVVTGAITIDTDVRTVDGAPPASWRVAAQPGGGPELFVVHYRDIAVLSAGTIHVVGSVGLALVASGRLEIFGRIDGAAMLGFGGPGGRDGFDTAIPPPNGDGAEGSEQPNCGSTTRTGGGGAAHGADGGPGGGTIAPTYPGGAGGLAVNSTAWAPLRGGSPGGRSATWLHLGGGGGGVVALVAAEEIVLGCLPAPVPNQGQVCGLVDVSGGGGSGHGSGGGSGGTVLLEAPTVVLQGGLHAVGGGGACGGVPWPGTDGAHGGRGCNSTGLDGGGGNGGLALNRLWSPSGGHGIGVFCDDPTSAGGGGGSAGRIRVHTVPGGLTVDPAATLRAAPCGATIEDCFGEVVAY